MSPHAATPNLTPTRGPPPRASLLPLRGAVNPAPLSKSGRRELPSRFVAGHADLLKRFQPQLRYDSQEAFFADSAAEWTDNPGNELRRAYDDGRERRPGLVPVGGTCDKRDADALPLKALLSRRFVEADDGTRTHDLLHGKQTL